jgi:hypothetical protein
MGTGHFNNVPTTEDGASWKYRNANRVNLWNTSSLPSGVTSS